MAYAHVVRMYHSAPLLHEEDSPLALLDFPDAHRRPVTAAVVGCFGIVECSAR